VRSENETVESSVVVVATGGSSYPKTGTTGDGYVWAKRLGHTIVPTRAALAPIGVKPKWPAEWRGVAIRGGCLAVFSNRKKFYECCDDILFSHEGISGPAALDVSRAAAEAMVSSTVHLLFVRPCTAR
jgi:predicted flavoprotein YhiN